MRVDAQELVVIHRVWTRFWQKPMADNQQDKQKPAEKPVSLKPLKVEEAVEALLRVKPVTTRKGEDQAE